MPRRLQKNPEIYNIRASLSFVDVLANGIYERFGDNPITLSEVLILLPNRRAVRSLRDAFLRLNDGKPTILPNMQPIGDVDEDGLIMAGGTLYDDLDLKPAVPASIRQMILMNIIHDWHKAEKKDIPENATCAVLAEALGSLLDQVQTEEIDFASMEDIVPDEYAIHWQQTLEFLKIVTEMWPDILATTGYMDAADRRNRLLRGLAEKWINNPPQFPIIAAGSTGSIKSTAHLLSVISRLPNGMVVLPGVDQNMDDDTWEKIEETHPQSTMKHLLDEIGVDRVEINNWDGSDPSIDHQKTTFFREIMRPAETTHLWRDLEAQKHDDITQIVTPGSREEAGVIALMMREQLEIPGKTAALVTPDRMLARQVAGELNRWGVEIDDSAGTPLFNKAVGVYLRLSAEMIAENFSPVSLMSMLKHPLTAGGHNIADFRANVRLFERKYLRGPRPPAGLYGIEKVMDHESGSDDALYDWWQGLKDIIEPFDAMLADPNVTFADMLIAHIEMAEKLAATDEVSGENRIWKGDDGEAAAKLIEDLQQAAPYMRYFKADQYAALFDQFMKSVTVRSKYGQHPRLNIWGPLEARLQHADLMILSGLNEGVWPPEAGDDPWMSRPMRRDFGLPGLEQKIGLSAHDFVQTASAGNVVITRAEKQDGTPTVKSRWLNRLHAIIGDHHHEAESAKWLGWYKDIDAPDKEIKIDPPAPKPPVDKRPRNLSVTRIQQWMQDPYSIYASKILNLKKLDELDQDPGAIDKGVMIHDILDEFMSRHKDYLPDDAEEILIDIGHKYFKEKIDKPTVRTFWWPRFKQIAKWFIETERLRRENIKTLATETNGRIDLKPFGGMFTLTAKADRIDLMADDTLSIIDYKTGSPPTLRSLKAGYTPQLPLEGVIAAQGGFDLIPDYQISDLSYWQLSGGETPGKISSFNASRKVDVMEEVQKSYDGLIKLVTTFDLPETPYLSNPNPMQRGYGEFDHLARAKEWGDG
ncbi:double-strand break repair protein AddB [Pseudemcibacter aquimaris]|uniref:double-strand break repair protein AddB n=1 Tax=Pseudemcibacter aquimaris TaxID=2857064 RepID=UPI002013A5FF|nr:double-strand break repair protein AddB [Pseudemcibacter aquimaris]MCC3860269.1 double-strand break repair protein AddB [Pseudemcibacter aquimaris]WDU57594.1 double-strand break repair protein AddB [Pseudemcibacter aquimaris]